MMSAEAAWLTQTSVHSAKRERGSRKTSSSDRVFCSEESRSIFLFNGSPSQIVAKRIKRLRLIKSLDDGFKDL